MKKIKIKKIIAREILDSRGEPTVEVDMYSNYFSRASVPSGKSKGKYEAFEIRDNKKRYFGKGVKKAIRNIEKIKNKLINKEFNQEEFDNLLIELDGTKNKSRIGANAILALSIAFSKLSAYENKLNIYEYINSLFMKNKKYRIPRPMFNIINGGEHAGNNLDIQEFLLIPKTKKFSLSLQTASEIYHELKRIIGKKYGKQSTNVGDEGGFTPDTTTEQALEMIEKASSNLGYKIEIGLDIAASTLMKKIKKVPVYIFNKKIKTGYELIDFYKDLIKSYPIISIEDPFSEDDYKNWYLLNKEIGKEIMLIGDDLLATNIKRIKFAHDIKLCNSVLLKMNQVGTLTETLDSALYSKTHNMKTIVSHRSGETNDSFISDLSVGISSDFIKAGAPCRGERLAKYNQLLRIEEEIENKQNKK